MTGRVASTRPLDPVYAVVFLDALVVKVRDNNVVQNKPAYIAIGIDTDGEKHVLGIWLATTLLETATAAEGARFWGGIMTDLRNRREHLEILTTSDQARGPFLPYSGGTPCTVAQLPRPGHRRPASSSASRLSK